MQPYHPEVTMAEDGNRAKIGVIAIDPLRSVGLQAILEETAGLIAVPVTLKTVAQEAEGLAALLLDARAGGDALPETIARLRRELPGLKIIVMGEMLNPEQIQSIVGAGAKGYLPETATENEIEMALDVVLDGSVWAPRKVLARLIEAGGTPGGGFYPGADGLLQRMTTREREVLEFLMDGRSNRGIAEAMGIDEATVKAHLGRMLRKAGATNRVELTLRAMEERRPH